MITRLVSIAALIVGSLVFAGRVDAQDLGGKAPPQQRPVMLIGGTVHTVSGETHEPGYVVFENGRITDVGPGRPRMAGGVEVIDCAGHHVYPGLIGAYTRIGLTEIGAARATLDHNEVGPDGISPEARAISSVNPDSTLMPVTRANGVLSVGVFPSGGPVPGRPAVVSLEGWTWEEMAVEPEAGVVINWPRATPITAWWMNRSEREQLEEAAEQRGLIEDLFERALAYRALRRMEADTPIDLRLEAMLPCIPGEDGSAPSRPTFISAQTYDQIVQAVAFADRFGLRLVVVGGQDADLAATELQRIDAWVLLTGTHRMPRREDAPYDDAYTAPARLEAAGLKWALASNEEAPHERSLPFHGGTAVAHGLAHDAAIRALTLSAAHALGVGAELGSIEAGKRATLIVTDGSPLEMTTRIEHAFINGRAIDLRSKHTDLRDKYRERYDQPG